MQLLIVLAVLWLLIGYLLAGNINFNFKPTDTFQGSPKASAVFWNINYIIVAAPIILASIYNLIRFIEIRKSRQ
jgi:hypothetical protein